MTEKLLHDLLAVRAARAGLPAPRVATLGIEDATAVVDGVDRHTATVHLTPNAVLVGPWGGPPTGGACGHCLSIRWQRLRPVPTRDALETGPGFQSAGEWPLPTRHLADAVWAVYAGTFTTTPTDGPARVTSVDVRTLIASTFPVLPEGRCPRCSVERAPDRAAADPRLRSRTKPGPDTYRLRRPSEYHLPVAALANPVSGAIGAESVLNLASTTTAPVLGMWRNRARHGLADMNWSGQTNNFARSREVGLLEGLERDAGSLPRQNVAPVIGSHRQLAGEALDPRDCGVYSDEAYASSDRLEPFDPDRAIPWVWGWSLRDRRPILVPRRIAYYSTGTDTDRFVDECSNGCASGGSVEEAILYGLLELIERDAFLLGWYGAAELTEIDVAGTATPAARAMLDRARFLGYHVRLFDNRIDLPVPAVTAVAERLDGGPGLLGFAAGASLDPDTAIEGALEEICSYVPSLPVSHRRRQAELEAMAGDFSLVRTLRDHAELFTVPAMREHARRYLEPARRLPKEAVYARRRPASTDLLDDVRYLCDAVTAAGHDVIVVDQTSPEQRMVGLHNVCMIVPGLIPIDFGWSLQRALHLPRMFTAQHRGGLRPAALTPADLHRVPHPFP
ncbi:TOMM precursor leader peptide-binding protein [Virgisporangium aurantiacum]|uniref:SagD family biosynthesis docking scaffold protein n=1 Tax=Virgisporangium aurantiacum TaxID=175570 RepID=A0A8J3Z445_9ACTN|nr:TOMM precursor leader peptide-binding protein [Virgisporangium aurantiacum]GIJ56047.1 SagD family biosynthesis docking scaffold protein [Virgisporangium aurantiacum]